MTDTHAEGLLLSTLPIGTLTRFNSYLPRATVFYHCCPSQALDEMEIQNVQEKIYISSPLVELC